jgi:hypothetical protein
MMQIIPESMAMNIFVVNNILKHENTKKINNRVFIGGRN